MKNKKLLKILTVSTLSLAMLIPQVTFASRQFSSKSGYSGDNDANVIPGGGTTEPSNGAKDSDSSTFTFKIHKLMYNNKDVKEDFIKNTGDELTIKDPDIKPYDKSKYGDVGFTLYAVDKSKISKKTPAQVASEIEQAVLKKAELPYGARKVGQEIKVDENGICTMSGSATVLYQEGTDTFVLVETTSSKFVKTKAKPILFQFPFMENGVYRDASKPIHLYPKNQIEELNLEFFKYAQDNKENKEKPLNGAKFKLYYGKSNDIANAKVIKDGDKDLILEVKDGKINLNNLIKGDYFLVELGVKDLVDDMLKDEGYEKYLVSGNAQYDKNNKLSFSVDDSGNINASKDFMHFVNYERPHSDKKIVNETKDKDLSKVKKNNYEIFEDIEFNVDVEIPKNVQDYSKLGFRDKLMLEDKTTNDLEYLENSFVVKCGDVTLAKDKDYTIKFNEAKNEFDFSLINNGKASDKLKDKVTVSYKAQFKNVTTIVANGNYKNHVDFVFNNSKFNNNKDRYEKKETKFTTYGFKVKKVNDTIFEMNAKGLKGAEFILQDESGDYFEGFKDGENGKTATFTDDEAKAHKFVTGEDGTFTVVGLKSGNYTLKEIKAPEGYRLNNDITNIQIKDDSHLDGTLENIVNTKDNLVVTGKEDLMQTVAIAGGSLALIAVIYKKTKKDEEKELSK